MNSFIKTRHVDNFAVVCFGDSDWWYHNRGHMDMQLMKRFAKKGRVLYVNSIVVRKFNVGEGRMFWRRVMRKLRSIGRGLKPSGIENMYIYSPFSMPVHHIRFARELNAFILRLQIRRCMRKLGIEKPLMWVACPGAAEVISKLPRTKLVYQRSDCYEHFPGVDAAQMRCYDMLLKIEADIVVYANRGLMNGEKSDCRKAVLLDHGVDYDLFAGAEKDSYIPEEMRRIAHPILGFYGSIDGHTSDISLLEKLADMLSEFSIVLIGNSSVDLTALASRKNVHLLGGKAYERIPHYAKCFDVCFMPWRQNKWINSCNPVKLKEYLALGKPIVSTRFRELENYGSVVSIASDADSFAEAVRKAASRSNGDAVLLRRKMVKNCTWDTRADEILNEIFCNGGVKS